LPSDTLHSLYRRLADVTERISSALDEADVPTLINLTREHRAIMGKLELAGQCQDPGLLDRIRDLSEQVHTVSANMHEKQDALCRHLVTFERKKQAIAVYATGRAAAQIEI
jgi:hypothetical protein